MATYEKTSLTLPADLFEAVSRAAKAEGRSRSETVAELIRLGLTARKQTDALYREIARLKQTIEDRTARLARAEEQLKTFDPRDCLTGAPPGTAKLRDDLAWAEKARRQAEADAAEARRAAKQLRRQVEELKGDLEEREEEIAERDEQIAALEERCAKADEACQRAHARRNEAEQALAAEQARKMPWHLRLRRMRFSWDKRPPREIEPRSFAHGLGAAFAIGLVALVATPHDTLAMRLIATIAMGTWGDSPKASARLHGGPKSGGDSFLQVYALVRAGDNPARLDACFERSLRLGSNDPPIDCTIQVPPEFVLYTDIVTSGPHAHTSRTRRQLERLQEKLEALEKAAR